MKKATHVNFSISNPLVRQAVYKAYDGKCLYTGRDVSFDEMHIDHIKPISWGGESQLANYALSSEDANRKKLDKFDEQGIVPVLYLVKVHFLPKMEAELARLIKEKSEEGSHQKRKAICNCPPAPQGIFLLTKPEFVLVLLVLEKYFSIASLGRNVSADVVNIVIHQDEFTLFYSDLCFESVVRSAYEKGMMPLCGDGTGFQALFSSVKVLAGQGSAIACFNVVHDFVQNHEYIDYLYGMRRCFSPGDV